MISNLPSNPPSQFSISMQLVLVLVQRFGNLILEYSYYFWQFRHCFICLVLHFFLQTCKEKGCIAFGGRESSTLLCESCCVVFIFFLQIVFSARLSLDRKCRKWLCRGQTLRFFCKWDQIEIHNKIQQCHWNIQRFWTNMYKMNNKHIRYNNTIQ